MYEERIVSKLHRIEIIDESCRRTGLETAVVLEKKWTSPQRHDVRGGITCMGFIQGFATRPIWCFETTFDLTPGPQIHLVYTRSGDSHVVSDPGQESGARNWNI
jgi:hypothetical protein